MDSSYDPEAWQAFAGAVAGASAALAGLLFVAMSINVREILSHPTLPPRAAAAVVTLTAPLVFSVLLLVPDQSDVALGVELIVAGALVGGVLTRCMTPYRWEGARSGVQWVLGTAGPSALLAASIVLAGVGTLTESVGGLDWLAVAVIAAIWGGLVQAWVLLIEILR